MSKFRVVLDAWLLALILFCVVAVPIFAAYSDCAYYLTVTVSNNSSTSYPNLRIVYDVNPASLVAGGYMQVDADDIYLMNGSTGLSSTALNMTSDGVHWLGVVNAPAHSNQALRLYTGWNAAAGRNQPWLAASGDVATVADSASLDITGNLTVSANLTIPAAPSVGGNITNRVGEYRLSVNATSYIFGVSKPGAAYTYNLVPNGTGVSTGITSVYAPSWAHWQAVGDSGNDTSNVYRSGGGVLYDYYGLTDLSLTSGYTISSLDIVLRVKSGTAPHLSTFYGFFRLGSVDGAMSSDTTTLDTYGNKTLANVARPGGGTWSTADLTSLQVGLGIQTVGVGYCSEVQVVVNYNSPSETSVSSALTPSATSHNVKGSYNGTAVDLYIDGVRTATTALTGSLNFGTNSTMSVLQFDGLMDDLRIGSGSWVSPTWVATYQFEAAQANSGQIMDQSGNGNTITYTLAGMPSGTGTAVGPLIPITLYISMSTNGTAASEPAVIPAFNIPLYENTTATGSNLLGYDIFLRGASSLGWSSATLYSVMFMEAAIAFGFAATIGTGTLFFGTLAGMGLLTLGAATGLLAWWIPLILGLLVFMSITVFKEL